MKIGFAGLGIMGSRMAINLHRAGFQLMVWNRTEEKAKASGFSVASSPFALAQSNEVVCWCLSNPSVVAQVVSGRGGLIEGARKGQLLIDFSTGSPALALELERLARLKEADFVEAPVTGSKVGAEDGTLLVMAGGSAQSVERAQSVFDAVGSRTIRCGEVGTASHIKLAGNALRATMLEGFIEGVLLCERAGIPAEKFYEVVQASGNRSPYFEQKGPAVINRDFETHFSVELMLKDLSLFLETSAGYRLPSPAISKIRDIYLRAKAAGLGEKDITSTVVAVESLSGPEKSGH